MSGPLLAVRGLTVRLGGHTILDRVDLDLAAGRRLAVTGPNGAGKTTLLDAIAGTRRPTRGQILLDGRDITHASAQRRARLGVARVWQQPALCPHLTTMDNLLLAVHDRSPAVRGERVGPILDQAGLGDRADIPAGRLSYGQQRELELALALAAEPRLLLLDEPTAGLDPRHSRLLADQLGQLDANVAVILTGHDPDLVALADTVTTLDHGHPPPAPIPPRAPPAGPPAPRLRPAVGATVLAVRHLSAVQHTTTILHGVDLDLQRGQILAITGANGAGKTTLLHTIAGLHPATSGTSIRLADRDLTGLSAAGRARAGLALVPQDRRALGELSVADQLRLPTHHHHQHHNTFQWTVERVLELLPILRPLLRRRAITLSEGERQALALARALLSQPVVLLLDEPFAGLAPAQTEQVAAVLATLTAHGMGIVLVEHDQSRLDRLAARVLRLKRGRLRDRSA